jgi:O-methyltransferase
VSDGTIAGRAICQAGEAYLELLKRTLIRLPMTPEDLELRERARSMPPGLLRAVDEWIDRSRAGAERPPDVAARRSGQDWPETGESMVGLDRLNNLQACVLSAIVNQVPGDVAETGVWRGGATILMRAILSVCGETERRVWVADSFEGLPPPDPDQYPADAGDSHWRYRQLAVPRREVEANFARYGLLDGQVRFLPGWFRDTLASAPIEALAVLRLDGDMYESTIVALRALHAKVQPGGYVVVDDYALPGCRQAVDDFRRAQGISAVLEPIDWTGVMWQVG